MPKYRLHSRTAINAKLPCNYPQCPRPRKSIANVCEQHWDAMATTGHFDGKLIPRSTIRPLQALAAEYIAAHRDAPIITTALDHITRTVIRPGQVPEPPHIKPRGLPQIIASQVYKEVRRLQIPAPRLVGAGVGKEAVFTRHQDGPVTAEEVLSVCVGVWLAQHLNHKLLMNDGECLNFALANAVLGLRIYRQIVSNGIKGRMVATLMPGVRVRRELGARLRIGPVSYACHMITEKLVPETPEQVRARAADARHIPLPDAMPEERYFPKAAPAAVPEEPKVDPMALPPRFPRPVMRSLADADAIRRWDNLNREWLKRGM